MKTMFDPKSVLLGAVVAVLFGCVVGADDPADPDHLPTPAVLRFQIESNEQHVFVLDTATGQVWQKYLPPNQGPMPGNFNEPNLGDDQP